jgi:hypothetical protein
MEACGGSFFFITRTVPNYLNCREELTATDALHDVKSSTTSSAEFIADWPGDCTTTIKQKLTPFPKTKFGPDLHNYVRQYFPRIV